MLDRARKLRRILDPVELVEEAPVVDVEVPVDEDVAQGSGTVFAEPGSTISKCMGCILYMKKGSRYNGGGIGVTIVYDTLASVSYIYDDYPIGCTSLDFDYTNAPPNPSFQLGVGKNIREVIGNVGLSPNPASKSVIVHGITENLYRISILNMLGESVIEVRNPHTSDMTIDISKLSPGSYFARFASADQVVTKKLIVK